MNTADTQELLDLATDLACRAAVLVSEGRERGLSTVDTKSSDTDLVTEMDRGAEALICDGIIRERPGDAILGEEGSARDGHSGVRWVIDPIDGTTNYVYDHPSYAVSIGVEIDGIPTVGVVEVPLHRDVFTAVRGQGARRNGQPITCSSTTSLASALVATGFAYDPARRAEQGRVVAGLLPEVRDLRRVGAASVDLCSVACGRVDVYYERGLSPWDHAAGALIASEAGATVGDLDGNPASSEFVLAAGPDLWRPVADLLDRLGAREA